MKKSWQTWLAFAICAAVAVAALAWLTVEAVRADLERSTASRQAELEQRISLVLWRMDTKLAPLIAEEVARPVFYFRNPTTWAFNSPPNSNGDDDSVPEMPSLPDNVILNFTCPSVGGCQSPQVPQSWDLENIRELNEPTQTRAKLFDKLSQQLSYETLLGLLPVGTRQQSEEATQLGSFDNRYAGNKIAENQSRQSSVKGGNLDLQQRAQRYDFFAQQEIRKQRDNPNYNNNPFQQQVTMPLPPPVAVVTGVTRPLWIGENLLLARRVVIDGSPEIQGSWLSWEGIRKDLLAEAEDLLPHANLSPVHDTDEADPTRMLAGLPAEIDPGEKFVAVELTAPMKGALWIGWIAFLFALIAAAILLAGVLALSERRAAFVSSVTHELRTPLTTFRMYSDMLVRDMVPDSQRRQEYLETLRSEAERLTHLVENVLSYARLERGRKVNRQETVCVEKIVERLEGRLAERATQAEMKLARTIEQGAGGLVITTDVGVVEQILFNLVDNACKYAMEATDRKLHWLVGSDDKFVLFTIRDHGPGFENARKAESSRPFSKTSEDAAGTAPGVGLGLALCRKLAKQLGGRLDIKDSPSGVTATLRLPRSSG